MHSPALVFRSEIDVCDGTLTQASINESTHIHKQLFFLNEVLIKKGWRPVHVEEAGLQQKLKPPRPSFSPFDLTPHMEKLSGSETLFHNDLTE